METRKTYSYDEVYRASLEYFEGDQLAANVWANNIRPEEVLNMTKSDPHSLGRWRVNGALPHIDAWYEAWNVTEESPMYVAPEKRVRVW